LGFPVVSAVALRLFQHALVHVLLVIQVLDQKVQNELGERGIVAPVETRGLELVGVDHAASIGGAVAIAAKESLAGDWRLVVVDGSFVIAARNGRFPSASGRRRRGGNYVCNARLLVRLLRFVLASAHRHNARAALGQKEGTWRTKADLGAVANFTVLPDKRKGLVLCHLHDALALTGTSRWSNAGEGVLVAVATLASGRHRLRLSAIQMTGNH
jgi:hypothetical protein